MRNQKAAAEADRHALINGSVEMIEANRRLEEATTAANTSKVAARLAKAQSHQASSARNITRAAASKAATIQQQVLNDSFMLDAALNIRNAVAVEDEWAAVGREQERNTQHSQELAKREAALESSSAHETAMQVMTDIIDNFQGLQLGN